MTETRETETREGLGIRLWGALKNSITEEDPVAVARRAKLRGGKPAPDAPRAQEAAPAAAPERLTPMARALLAQVLSKATAYTALTEKLALLESIVVDERTRYQAAFALISSSRSVEQVVQSIDVLHVQALDEEAARFAAQLQEKERTEIGERTQELQGLATAIDAATQQVARIREDAEARIRQVEAAVVRDRERVDVLSKELDARQQELVAVQRRFDAAARVVKDELSGAKATVLRHLG